MAREEVNRGTTNQGKMTFTRDSQIEEAGNLEAEEEEVVMTKSQTRGNLG